jgi:hypothetical protein
MHDLWTEFRRFAWLAALEPLSQPSHRVTLLVAFRF